MQRFRHPSDHVLLLASDRALQPWRQARIHDHLERCPACRARQARLQTGVEWLADDVRRAADAPDESAMSPLRARLLAAMRQERHDAGQAWTWMWPFSKGRRLMRATPVMAALALSVGLLIGGSGVELTSLMRQPGTSPVVLPVASLTPGAVSTLSADALCAGARPSRVVPASVRDQVLSDYGMQGVAVDTFELDALITPELGGTASRENLWPQRYTSTWNAHVKDALEAFLARQVCNRQLPLADAQHALAADWIAAYQRFFRTAVPSAAHLASREVDDDLIVAAPLPSRPASRERARRLPQVRLIRTDLSPPSRVPTVNGAKGTVS